MKYAVTITKFWHRPEIKTMVFTCQEIEENIFIRMECSLEDFVKALRAEIGPVRWVWNEDRFTEIMEKAAETVIENIKKESTKVICS